MKELAGELGTPFFLVSEARLRANYNALVRGFSGGETRAIVRYCAKTNNEPGVLRILAACGSHALVCHHAEARLAVECGFPPERIAYQRPLLAEDEIREVLRAGISLVHAYRLQDIDIIEKAASELGINVKISLRLRADIMDSRLSPMSFVSRRLGMRESAVFDAAKRIRGSKWVSLAGINFYRGTQQESVHSYQGLLRRSVHLAARIKGEMGIPVEEINLGGGIPSPSIRRMKLSRLARRLRDESASSNPADSPEDFARNLRSQFEEETRRAGVRPQPTLVVEPGRAVVGNAGVLVTRVHGVEGRWIYVDASRNYLGESSILFTRRVLPAVRADSGARRYYHISGSTLNTLDVIDYRRRLPVMAAGDVVALCDAGAYSISRASRYAGLSPPVYLLRTNGTVEMIRRPEGYSDLAGLVPIRHGSEVLKDA